ncbi:hypothetical protein ABTZ58_35440 [Streptomyces sp. NPDC094143]|uniref:hypothetical protein n=1 Tax=Streptomyces sp. NPDC094143 TaxID=3155310 RepID=UPI00331E8A08
MTTLPDHAGDGPGSAPDDDPLAVILRPSSDRLPPPPGRYRTIRRGAARRRLVRTAVGAGVMTCAVTALVVLPLRLTALGERDTQPVPLAPPPASSMPAPPAPAIPSPSKSARATPTPASSVPDTAALDDRTNTAVVTPGTELQRTGREPTAPSAVPSGSPVERRP